ncbi:hypothetical protein [Buchnera aphidicola]|uniref:hypothetical protein n=1 Tax=Buchnera aphidicola TaxID=9 RepID=UPI003464DA28
MLNFKKIQNRFFSFSLIFSLFLINSLFLTNLCFSKNNQGNFSSFKNFSLTSHNKNFCKDFSPFLKNSNSVAKIETIDPSIFQIKSIHSFILSKKLDGFLKVPTQEKKKMSKKKIKEMIRTCQNASCISLFLRFLNFHLNADDIKYALEMCPKIFSFAPHNKNLKCIIYLKISLAQFKIGDFKGAFLSLQHMSDIYPWNSFLSCLDFKRF